MTTAISKAKTKLKKFLQKTYLLPKHLISMGAVRIPTITKVVTKAATALTLAPCLRSDPAIGKAMNAWISTTEPNKAARMTPSIPDSGPMNLEMISGGRKTRRKPIVQMVDNINRAMDRKNFQATNKDLLVFSLFFDQEKPRPKSAAVQITALKINPSPQLYGQDGHPGVGLQRSGFYFFGDENPRMLFYLFFLSVHNDFPRSRQNEKNNIAVHFAGRDPLSGLETHDLGFDSIRIIKDGLGMAFLRKLNH